MKRKHRQTPAQPSPKSPARNPAAAAAVPAQDQTPTPNRPWLPALLLFTLTVLAYLPVWHAGFIWDDTIFLSQNPMIIHPHGLYKFWLTTEAPDYFPMTSSMLWLEWRLWGNHPLGYHLVNLALHAFSALIWWRVLALLKIPGAWLAAALFALHPVNVESVVWITERKNTLAMFFAALSVLSFVKFEYTGRSRFYWFAAAAFTLGMLSKTAVAPLPMVLLGVVWWIRGRLTAADIKRSLLFFGITAVLAAITVWFQYNRAIGEAVVREGGLASRFAGAGWAVWFYLFQALFPLELIPVYPRWQINTGNPLSYIPSVLLGATLAWLWLKRNDWGRAWFLALAFFVLMLSPVLGFLDISYMRYSLVADRWQYFALLGPLTLAAAGLTRVFQKFSDGAKWRPFHAAAAAALLGGLGFLTWQHSWTYATNEKLWEVTTAKNPKSFLAENNFGNVLLNRGDTDRAIVHFQKALALFPDYPEGLSNLGVALVRQNRPDEAIAHFRKALEVQPDCVLALSNLRLVLLPRNQPDEIIERSRRALPIRPKDPEVHYNLAVGLVHQGQVSEGVAALQKALELQPAYAAARNAYAEILFQQGSTDLAIAQFRQALQSRPDLAEAHASLGVALLQKDQVSEAIQHLENAVLLRPELVEPRVNLGIALRKQGRIDEAIAQYRQAIELRSDLPIAHNNLGNALMQKGQPQEALAHYLKYLDLRPGDLEAHRQLAWTLATSPEAATRNGSNAVIIAERGSRLAGGTNAIMLGTLAAAYAEAGQFPRAVQAVQQALELARRQTNNPFVSTFEAHLARYQAGLSLRSAEK